MILGLALNIKMDDTKSKVTSRFKMIKKKDWTCFPNKHDSHLNVWRLLSSKPSLILTNVDDLRAEMSLKDFNDMNYGGPKGFQPLEGGA